MSEENESLSGFWSGVYDYPDSFDEAVPFNVILTDEAGTLTGEIIEPNTFSPEDIDHMFASLNGNLIDNSIMFIKTYENADNAGHRVRYEGIVNPEKTVIQGEWTTLDEEFPWSGPFIMNRTISHSETTETRETEELHIK